MSTTTLSKLMPGTRLYFAGTIVAGDELTLEGDQARYVGRVLRLRPGDPITLFDGRGAEFSAVVVTSGKNTVQVSVGEQSPKDVESPLRVHLLQGISRGERMDFVIQKATELGVARITPVLTEYSVVKLEAKRAEKRLLHWRGVAVSACEQCGRNVLPQVDEAIGLRDWLGANQADQRRRIILQPGAKDSISAVDAGDAELVILIGPEGGFSDSEYELAAATGFQPIGFGPRILRTETAALAVLTALQTLYGDLG